MINDILFLMTAPIVIVNLLMILSITFGSESSLTLPPLLFNVDALNPNKWFIFYPTIFYQVYFWSSYFEVINC
jgi:hypothetical protein